MNLLYIFPFLYPFCIQNSEAAFPSPATGQQRIQIQFHIGCASNSECEEYLGQYCSTRTKKCECIEADGCKNGKKFQFLRIHESCSEKTFQNGTESVFRTCPINSYCSEEDETCTCQKGYTPTLEFGCIPEMVLAYPRKQCQVKNSDQEQGCNVDGDICIRHICHRCLMGHPSKDEKGETRCKLKLGDICQINSLTAICPGRQNCDPETKKCSCNSGFTYFNESTSDCELLPDFGESCEETQKCQKSHYGNIQCVENICKCKENESYDKEKGMCIANRVGSPCTNSGTCPYGSECSEGVCTCRENDAFTRIDDACEPNLYGRPCDSTRKQLYGIHQKIRRIKCIDGIYQCESMFGMRYDSKGERCVTLAGAQCDLNINDPHQCPKNSECQSNRNSNGQVMVWSLRPHHHSLSREPGTCKCKLGFSPTPYGQCLASNGSPCQEYVLAENRSTSSICNMFNGLICMNGTCQCPEPTFSEVLFTSIGNNLFSWHQDEKCVSPTGYFCGKQAISSQQGVFFDNTEEDCIGCNYYYFDCSRGKHEVCVRDERTAEGDTFAVSKCKPIFVN